MIVNEFLILRLCAMYRNGDRRGIGAILELTLQDEYKKNSDEEMMDILIDVERRVIAKMQQDLKFGTK